MSVPPCLRPAQTQSPLGPRTAEQTVPFDGECKALEKQGSEIPLWPFLESITCHREQVDMSSMVSTAEQNKALKEDSAPQGRLRWLSAEGPRKRPLRSPWSEAPVEGAAARRLPAEGASGCGAAAA